MIERLLMGAIVATLLAGLYITSGDQSEAERHAQHYCDMVEIWDKTAGEYGWPPYKGRGGCEK